MENEHNFTHVELENIHWARLVFAVVTMQKRFKLSLLDLVYLHLY